MRAPAGELPIRIEDASVSAGAITILDRVTLTISAGAPTMLIGPNGAGKTTLLKLAMGLMAPTSGRVSWNGGEVSRPGRRALMFQRPVMLRRSSAGNVRYALAAAGVARSERAARTDELLSLVGLSELGDRPARKLSGGEQQRVALARALAKDPAVLFLDEPTASLDPAATKAVEDVIRAVGARGIKVVLATHDLSQAHRVGGEIVLLHRGRIVEASPAEAFFTQPKTSEARRFVAGELLV
jgi:tungstate transport system ATP-binding protein